jgi:hypothetical protein
MSGAIGNIGPPVPTRKKVFQPSSPSSIHLAKHYSFHSRCAVAFPCRVSLIRNQRRYAAQNLSLRGSLYDPRRQNSEASLGFGACGFHIPLTIRLGTISVVLQLTFSVKIPSKHLDLNCFEPWPEPLTRRPRRQRTVSVCFHPFFFSSCLTPQLKLILRFLNAHLIDNNSDVVCGTLGSEQAAF